MVEHPEVNFDLIFRIPLALIKEAYSRPSGT
jgi:hypothetical protein